MKFLFLFLIILFCGGALIFAESLTRGDTPERVSFLNRTFALEVVETPDTRRLGLGGREALCFQCGMLFLFETPGIYDFWMKDMRFPIDIIWISEETVVHVERSVSEKSESLYRSEVPADRVLEVNAGSAEGLFPGARVSFSP